VTEPALCNWVVIASTPVDGYLAPALVDSPMSRLATEKVRFAPQLGSAPAAAQDQKGFPPYGTAGSLPCSTRVHGLASTFASRGE